MKLHQNASRAPRFLGHAAEHGSAYGGSFSVCGSRSWPLFMIALLVLITLPFATAFGGDPPTLSVGDGEDETTLPMVPDLGAGLVLVGTLGDVHRLVGSVTGPGEITFHALDPEDPTGLFLVVIHGNVSLTLDQSQLASTPVNIYFSAGSQLLGGMAQVGMGANTFSPFVLDEMIYEMPIAALFSSADGASVPVFGLFAMGPDFERYRFSARAQGGIVELIQRSSF